MPERTLVHPSFLCGGLRVTLTPVIDDPAHVEPRLYRFPCPQCQGERKLAASRIVLPRSAPDLVTIEGLLHCAHGCGWSAEIVRGVAHVLGREP